MKKAILVIMLSGWWHSIQAQAHGGMEQYYSLQGQKSFAAVPVVYIETSNNWYAEGRYNYEAPGSASLYAGKTFTHDAALSFSVSPLAGIVAGRYKGGSAGFNMEMNYKKFLLSTQAQYTFSITDKADDFSYSWTDFAYQLTPVLSAGLSMQQTHLYETTTSFETGVFAEVQFKNWSLPIYIFRPAGQQRYFMLGLSCEWQYKKR